MGWLIGSRPWRRAHREAAVGRATGGNGWAAHVQLAPQRRTLQRRRASRGDAPTRTAAVTAILAGAEDGSTVERSKRPEETHGNAEHGRARARNGRGDLRRPPARPRRVRFGHAQHAWFRSVFLPEAGQPV